jgi:hypothetical protein
MALFYERRSMLTKHSEALHVRLAVALDEIARKATRHNLLAILADYLDKGGDHLKFLICHFESSNPLSSG